MDDVMGLIDRAHHGDERARAQLVEQNMGLVWSIVPLRCDSLPMPCL